MSRQASVISHWKDLPPEPFPPVRQPGGYGDHWPKIKLKTNHFPVTVGNPDLTLYHYDVTVKDFSGKENLPKKLKMAVFEEMKKIFPKNFGKVQLGFDSMKSAYSTKLIRHLTSSTKSFKVPLKREGVTSNFYVSIIKVNEARLSDFMESIKYPSSSKEIPFVTLQMLEVMFRHNCAVKYIQVGDRSFYDVNGEFGEANFLGGGKVGVTGFFASLRPAVWKNGSLLLNLDCTHTAFYKEEPVMDFLKDCCFLTEDDFRQTFNIRLQKQAVSIIKGLKVRVTHSSIKRTYKVAGISNAGADKLYFDKDGENMSVKNYMRDQYGYCLKYPWLNCLQVSKSGKDIYLPIEVCHIMKGQRVMKKLNDREMQTFIKETAIPPAERLKKIQATLAQNKFNEDPLMKDLSFTISDMPLELTGKVLPAPSLTMKEKKFYPIDGVWNINDKKFHVGASLEHWAVINYDHRTPENSVLSLVDDLVKMGNSKGMKINEPFDIYNANKDSRPSTDFKFYKEENPAIQLIVCILPNKEYYGSIKTAGDIEYKIITQCVLGVNARKAKTKSGIIENLLLQINGKLLGVNNIVGTGPIDLVPFKEPFMIMGADVNHPAAGVDEGIPSFVAVVGSYDTHATKYAIEVRAQQQRVEIIEDLTEITVKLLLAFYKANKGKKPSRIVMYRDGVGESQFQKVLSGEVNKMRGACKRLSADGSYKPGITFICVQKGHHTRFFCDEKDGVGRCKNVPPGTTVDTDITDPSQVDFYMVPHQGIQGTSRPGHYRKLWDDNDLPIKDLQALTYSLCHVYARCARSVSIPAPVYYADLAAFRAKVHLSDWMRQIKGSDTMPETSAGSEGIPTMDEIKRRVKVSCDSESLNRFYYL